MSLWLYRSLTAWMSTEFKKLSKDLSRDFTTLSRQIATVATDQTVIVSSVNNIEDRLTRIEKLLTPPPTAPAIVSWRLTGERKDEENDMWLLTYEVDLPAVADSPANADVVTQRIAVVVDGEEVSTQDLPKLAEKATVEIEKGKTATLRRSLIDDDGNPGPSVDSETFVAKDTIPPDAPGAFGELRLLGEREVPDEPSPESTTRGRR